ncbi:subtilisin family serine protease [Laceyella sediminis]|uniref:Subtilisin family serine protease n=1 Tax=Laceyella sediminis TaxID=573074 RepID=A0ABX5EME6_9BACL|nr:S8 family peptidase [Laceyella sediminis]PRZ12242.1 subtilisin family serine protease [Laceyella sediminis]
MRKNRFKWLSLSTAVLLCASVLTIMGGGQSSVTANESNPHQKRVVVKLKDHLVPSYQDGVEKAIRAKDKTNSLPNLKMERLFRSIEPNRLHNMIHAKQARPDLMQYYAVTVPKGMDAEQLAKQYERSSLVELAYVEGTPVQPPAVTPQDDPRSGNQGYLKPAPEGIDAHFAWTKAGGDGSGITFVDLEQGWELNHEDLAAKRIQLISGVNKAYHSHGTAVLGEVVAVDNTLGDIGITPNATAKVVSQWRTQSTYSTADAILSAVNTMKPGDVLLLEAQTTAPGYNTYLPVEVEPAVFDAIRTGTDRGITIVEAAGNGANDLDAYKDSQGKYVLNRNSPDFRDSGAIMVGAASSGTVHKRLSFSNYGSRIDCYGWGENIDTTYGNLGETNRYTTSFNGTSGASPIVAGAAVAVQGAAYAKYQSYYSPATLRSILSNPQFGTPSANPSTDKIGVMPDLRKILYSF